MTSIILIICLVVLSIASGKIDLLGHRTWQFWMRTRDGSGGFLDRGVNLHTRVVVPRDFVDDGSVKYPVVTDRSPYGYFGLEWIADLLVPFGFVAVGQDMRGTGYSGGNFTMWHSDNDDGEDLGNWAVDQKWSDGRVFTFGASADGLASFTVAHNQPRWLSGQYIMVSSSEAYEVLMPNGAYLYHLVEYWLNGTVRPKDLDNTYNEFFDNEAKTEWWKPLDMGGLYHDLIKFPSGFFGGWYDIFLPGTLISYDGYNYGAAEGYKYQSRILMDPLGHCQMADVFFPQDLIAGRSFLELAQMLETYGIQPVKRQNIKNVTFYVMSSNDSAGLEYGNYWTSLEYFPEFTPTNLYLHSDGTADWKAPTDGSDVDTSDSTTFTYDPSNPVMGYGGNNLSPLECGPLEQGPSEEGRNDILKYNLAASDEPIFLTGPIKANLFVSSDALDTDFTAKLIDVFPTGEQRLLQDSAFRMRWREKGLEPVAMEKGVVYPIEMSLWNTSFVLAPGHVLRVSISSSNYPRFGVNLNNMNSLKQQYSGIPDANVTAQNTIHHSASYPSHITLPVVQPNQLPKLNNIKEQVMSMYPQLEHMLTADGEIDSKKNEIIKKLLQGPRFADTLIPKNIETFSTYNKGE
jgi:predicted acyl esterase